MRKKKTGSKKLVVKEEAAAEVILSHPVFRDMAGRLETIHAMLKNLPNAIGQAVAEASLKAPEGACGPPVPLVDVKEVEISKRQLSVDGQKFDIRFRMPQSIVLDCRSNGRTVTSEIGEVLGLTKSGVVVRPIRKGSPLGDAPCEWSLESGKRIPPKPVDEWRIMERDLDTLILCAVEIKER